MQLELTDLSGKLIYSRQILAIAGKNEITLNRDMLKLPNISGVFLVNLSGKHQQFTRRIILE